MANRRIATLTFRIDPSLKKSSHAPAHAEHRAIAKMTKVLIRGSYEQRGVAVPDFKTENKSGERS